MRRERVAGRSGSRAGSRMWALITARVPAAIAARNGREFTLVEASQAHVDARHVVVRVDGGVAVAGEVLGAGGDAGGLQPGDVGGGVPGDEAGVGAEGPYADDRVGRVGVDVGGRAPS